MIRPSRTKVVRQTIDDARSMHSKDVAGKPAALPGERGGTAAGANREPPSFDVHRSLSALAPGARLAEFELLGLIGEGGFGIVYLAYDTQLGRRVALKEFLPGTLATRVGNEVVVRSSRQKEVFDAGLRSFINEARLLARFDHRSLVKVYRFWEANGTAYMVMPYYEGMTLEQALQARDGRPDENWLKALLAPIAEALWVLHEGCCYHRDISPDNIILLKGSGRPVLLDFGAARHVIGDRTQQLTVIFKPGYAPVEQYAEVPSLKQGPWTDIYALAAVVYFVIQGQTPPPSMARYLSDGYTPLETAAAGRYSARFLRAIDRALAVKPANRPQSIAEFAADLDLRLDVDSVSPHSTRSAADRQPASGMARIVGSENVGGMGKGAVAGSSRAIPIGIAAFFIALVAAGAAWWFLTPPVAVPPPGATSVAAVRNGATSASAAVSPGPPRNPAMSAASAASGATVNPPREPVALDPSATLPAYTPGGEMERITTLADPSLHVLAQSRNATARIDRDHLQFTVTSNRNGLTYVFMVDPNGQYVMLFPNQLDMNNAIAAGQKLVLPRASWQMLAGEPPGPNVFLVIVSALPRDFSDAGLRAQSPFSDFPPAAQLAAAARRTPDYSPFAGKPRCLHGVDCADIFGAATFRIDVVKPIK